MTAFEIIEAFPLRSELIEEAVAIVKGGGSKRSAGIAVYDRFFGSQFGNDDYQFREDRLRHIAKLIRSNINSAEEKSQL